MGDIYMIIKEISKIIIDAENGTLRFNDDINSLKDFGAVKFIYDQKNDASLCDAFLNACVRMIDELHYDGIYPVLKSSLDDRMYHHLVEYQELSQKNALIYFLKNGTKNQIIVEMNGISDVNFVVGKQLESGKEWTTFSDSKSGHTLTSRFVDFAIKYNNYVSSNAPISQEKTKTSSDDDIM